jgi:TatA/E family protein of Tat protein translocase
MPTPGPLELVIILVIALLVLGPGKLPDVGAALGKSIREFRKASSDIQESVQVDTSPIPAAQPAAAAPAAAAPAPAAPAQVTAPVAPAPEPVAASAAAAEPVVVAAPDVAGAQTVAAVPATAGADETTPRSE